MSCFYQSTQESKELDLTSLQSKFDITTKPIKFYLFAYGRSRDFPEGGAANSKKCHCFQNRLIERLHENERIWTPGDVPAPHPDPPIGLIWNVTMLAATRNDI